MITQERAEGPTPAGGAYAIAFFRSASGEPADKLVASAVEIIEYAADDAEIARTYMEVPGKRTYAEWDESKHPRHPAGDERGGEFRSKSEQELLAETTQKGLMAFGSRPAKEGELKKIFHYTSPESALKILGGEGFVPVGVINPEHAKFVYRNSGGEKFVYFGLTKQGAGNNASAGGVLFIVNANAYRKHALVDTEMEEGLVMYNGVLPRSAITGIVTKDARVQAAWDARGKWAPSHYSLDDEKQRLSRILESLESSARSALTGVLIDVRAELARKMDLAHGKKSIQPLQVPLALQHDILRVMTEMLRRAREHGQRDAREEVGMAFAQWDESKHPRHPAGDDRGGEFKNVVDVYHGTALAYVDSIREHGLLMKAENRVPGRSERATRGEHGRSVFVTPNRKAALAYAHSAADNVFVKSVARDGEAAKRGPMRYLFGNPKHPVGRAGVLEMAVLHFQVPRSVAKEFLQDKYDDLYSPGARQGLKITSGRLDKKYLKGYEIFQTTSDSSHLPAVLVSTKRFEEGERDIFVTVICAPVPFGPIRNYSVADFLPRNALKWLGEKAFWISGVLAEDLTNEAQAILLNGLKTGKPLSELIAELGAAFIPYLGDPELADQEQAQPHRLETIIRTNTVEAYNHGRMSEFVTEEMRPFLDGLRYSAILDERTTPVCQFLHEKVFKPDDPALEGLLPPNHFNCRSVVVPVVVGSTIEKFITPEEIAEAQSLADQKFLAEQKRCRQT